MPPTITRQVYNLEFPVEVHRLEIGTYVFERVPSYGDAFQALQHLVNSSGSEFPTRVNTGSHQVTATVVTSLPEPNYVLPWEGTHTQLSDITLLLSIFTGRHVFAVDRPLNDDEAIISDHRKNRYGGVLECSPNFEEAEVVTGDEWWQRTHHDIGFERTLNDVLALIQTPGWQAKYRGGNVLILYKSAIEKRYISDVFSHCWTIWSHIFGIENLGNYTEQQIRRTSEAERMTYVLKTYFYPALTSEADSHIERLARARHRIVHFGQKPDDISYQDLELFVRATESLVAKILNLQPSNVRNTSERLSRFIAQPAPAEGFKS